jgi:hypothetical protein
MKRDMDLVRELLLEIEAVPAGGIYDTTASSLTTWDRDTLDAHLRMMNEAGFIDGFTETSSSAFCNGLSWWGHEFLDDARSPKQWAESKRIIREKGIGASVDVLRDVLKVVAKQWLGLPD